MAGRVIVLNGTSSSGKSSLGRALQDRLDGTWLLLGLDTFITALPWRLYGTAEGHTIHEDGVVDVGAGFRTEQTRWRHALAQLAREGSNVILDEVFVRGADEQAEWRAVLDGLDVTWVGVRCDVEEAVRRETERGDRSVGMARAQAGVVHVRIEYDVEVDTTATSPEALAAQVQAALS